MDYSKQYATWWSGNCYHLDQLDAIINSTDVKAYAHILHDKCPKDDGTGELKKPHYHYLVQLTRNQRGSWFKQFASEDMGIVFAKPVKCPQSAYDYLIHDTDKCRKQGKVLYDPSSRTSTIDNFDAGDKEKKNSTERFFEKLYEGATNMELQSEFPTLYAQFGVDKIEKFRQDYLKEKYGNDDREVKVTYIYGATRLGKTTYVRDKHEKKDICRVTNYRTGTFESYNAHKVLLLDEFTGKGLEIEFVNNLLDKLPLELPARYSNRTACYLHIYIVSNLPMSELYKDAPDEVRKAFVGRFQDVIKFTAFCKYHFEQCNGMRVLSPEEAEGLPF